MACKVDGCIGHRHRVLTNSGISPNFFGNPKGAGENTRDAASHRTGFLCNHKSGFELPEDLGLAKHHGIKPCCHSYEMGRRLSPMVTVGAGGQRFSRKAMKACNPVDQGIAGNHGIDAGRDYSVYFSAVAGRQDNTFFERGGPHQRLQRPWYVLRGKGNLLAGLNRRRIMVDSNGD